jgi:hypothetical protein
MKSRKVAVRGKTGFAALAEDLV